MKHGQRIGVFVKPKCGFHEMLLVYRGGPGTVEIGLGTIPVPGHRGKFGKVD